MGVTNELEEWISKRSLWIQNAINRITTNDSIDKEDITQLVELCKKEAGILKDINGDLKPIKVSLGHLNNEDISNNLVIESISNLTGMFALSPRKPLQLGKKPLTVVYGRNGSGKSSYVKVLKHMCGARNPGKLISNIFENKNQIKSCNIDIKIGDNHERIYWKQDDGVSIKLKETEIYDTDCAYVYVNSENEVTYEPRLLTLLTRIIDVCTKVSEVIEKEIENNQSKKPSIPKEYMDTDSGRWYLSLSAKSNKDFASKCQWNGELDKQLQALKERLNVVNPIEQAKTLRNKVNSLNKLIKSIEEMEKGLGDDICNKYLELKKDAELKKRVANEDVDKVLGMAQLEGVGIESWKILWQQAREYSEKIAYTDKVFPNVADGARCVLCQQPLDEEAKNRLISFEEFIKGNIQKQAETAELEFKNYSGKIINIPEDSLIELTINSCGIVDEIQIALIKSIYNDFELRKKSLLSAINTEDIANIPNIDFLKNFRNEIDIFEQKAITFHEDAKNQGRDIIQKKVCELEANKWLHQQKESIEEEIQRLLLIEDLKKAKRLTSTQAFSVKKSELSNKLVTEEYMNRFQKELKLLGAYQLKVELVKTKTQKGHIYHQIKLQNCKESISTSEVLSEGEMRIVSLAAFLADVESRKSSTPFIFDDPISSLDQEYEEATVERLVELSKNRQVIVFTHRISLLTLIEDAVKKHGVEASVVSLRNEQWGAGEPNETPINVKSPDAALNSLINERLSKAVKILNDFGQSEYETIAKSICSDFRIIIERFVENKLLCDVVQRFRRSINTLGKLEKIPLITVDDCKLFDELMTKYSKYEHSQSIELPVFAPSVEELREDMEKLKKWNEEFKKRVK
ncbi:AAA family ATPase [Clostridium paridis]|uniref:AAA family ATPase n=1 Tax=Clostridium paridis TaxID=2803863 RepID=A0A937K4U3_9CLOT|nr:AAA family ATPase [Clostridium paridis]MBL4933641.1 AAA family ATPase [Clostridium paridis]